MLLCSFMSPARLGHGVTGEEEEGGEEEEMALRLKNRGQKRQVLLSSSKWLFWMGK